MDTPINSSEQTALSHRKKNTKAAAAAAANGITHAVEDPDLPVRRGPRHAVPVVVYQRAVVPGDAPQVGAQLPNVVHGGVVGPPVLGPVVAVRSEIVNIRIRFPNTIKVSRIRCLR